MYFIYRYLFMMTLVASGVCARAAFLHTKNSSSIFTSGNLPPIWCGQCCLIAHGIFECALALCNRRLCSCSWKNIHILGAWCTESTTQPCRLYGIVCSGTADAVWWAEQEKITPSSSSCISEQWILVCIMRTQIDLMNCWVTITSDSSRMRLNFWT